MAGSGTSALLEPRALALTFAEDSFAANRQGPWGLDLGAMDLAVRPGDSFNRFVNGTWLDRTEIPPDRSSYGPTVKSGEVVEQRLRAIVEETGRRGREREPRLTAMSGLYYSFMDEARIEALGTSPLEAGLKGIRSSLDHEDLARLMGASHADLRRSLFQADVSADASGSGRYVLYLSQSGLGLPDRSYYLQQGLSGLRRAYREYLTLLLELIGWVAPAASAERVLAFETELARVSWSLEERRDASRNYVPVNRADFERRAGRFPWQAFLAGAGLDGAATLILRQSSAFPRLADVFAATPLADLKAWQAAHLADRAAPYLTRRFVDAWFDFRGRALTGQLQVEPRWRRGVALVDQVLGDWLGQEFVERHFPDSAKAEVRKIVDNVRRAMENRIRSLDWMTANTKGRALAKLARLGVKVAYPDRWRDYSGLVIRADDLLGNVRRSAKFEWAFKRRRIGHPLDPNDWAFTPQTAQAYYSNSRNEIVFCAGMLQPPNFDPLADPAINYGAVGAIIGHEIVHGFDDQGRKYDGDGALRDWWSPEDAREFEARAAVLADQFNRMEALPDLHLNGRATLGENLADLGGVLLALDAYRLSLGGAEAAVIGGFTGEQRVLLGWAQKWRRKMREAEVRRIVASDTHVPNGVRAEAPLRNVDTWYEAFGVTPRDRLYLPPEQRVRIW